jgi:hypothetical protein
MAPMSELPQRPELVSTGKSTSWKLPALVVAVAIVAFVALIRFTQPATPAPTPSPVAAVPTATPRPSPSASPSPPSVPLAPDGLTYVDGVPALVHGVQVIRVSDAARLPVGRTVLVGGWYPGLLPCPTGGVGQDCQGVDFYQRVPTGAFQSVIALDKSLGGAGARVVLATTEADPACSIVVAAGCQERLHVVDTVWSALSAAAQAPPQDQWRLDVITAVGKDPNNFGGAYINDANALVVLYVSDVAKANLEITVHTEITVEYQKVANTTAHMNDVIADLQAQDIAGVADIEIDIPDNRVGVYGNGVPIQDIMRLGSQYPGLVAFFGHPGATHASATP